MFGADVILDDQHWSNISLLRADDRVQIGIVDIASFDFVSFVYISPIWLGEDELQRAQLRPPQSFG